jgi:hypothetical protein
MLGITNDSSDGMLLPVGCRLDCWEINDGCVMFDICDKQSQDSEPKRAEYQ